MDKYLTTFDIQLLRDNGFKASESGASWFGIDKTGEAWQAYVVEGDSRITFVGTNDRTSIFMERNRFDELFSDA